MDSIKNGSAIFIAYLFSLTLAFLHWRKLVNPCNYFILPILTLLQPHPIIIVVHLHLHQSLLIPLRTPPINSLQIRILPNLEGFFPLLPYQIVQFNFELLGVADGFGAGTFLSDGDSMVAHHRHLHERIVSADVDYFARAAIPPDPQLDNIAKSFYHPHPKPTDSTLFCRLSYIALSLVQVLELGCFGHCLF